MSKYLKISAISLILLGILLRVLVIYQSGPPPHYELNPYADEINYMELATNISSCKYYGSWSEGFFTQSSRSPGYPVFLAAINKITGKSPTSFALTLNLILDLINIFLVYLLGRKIFGNKTGLLSALLYATLGAAFIYVKFATSEIFAMTLLLLSCYFLSSIRNSYLSSTIGFAVTFAFLIHTKPVFLLVTPFMLISLYLCINTEKTYSRLLKSAIPVLIIFILCIPWAIRNYVVHRTLIPVCTFSGWHLLVSAEGKDELSSEKLTNYIYDPKRSDFTEGQYYRESEDVLIKSVFSHPINFLASGIYRICYHWLPREPYLRIFQPKAYLMPIYITDKIFVPVPDFEGILYVLLIIAVIAAIRLKKIFIATFRKWLLPSAPFIILIIFYTVVHLFGVPLEQYRFIIEPLFIILACGFAFTFFSEETQPSGKSFSAKDATYDFTVPAFMLLIVGIATLGKASLFSYTYPKTPVDPACMSYAELRITQMKNLGNIPKNTVCETMGEVKYIRKDLEFDANLNRAEKKKGSAVAKLYIKLYDPENPKGIGDMKLNFIDGDFPYEGDFIKVKGPVYTGEYKDIIMHVEQWEKLK